VISAAASGKSQVKALVYVAAFAPAAGESAFTLSEKFPGSSLGETLVPVPLADGLTDLYIDQAKFSQQFAADVPDRETRLMAATQRPVADAALNELAGEPAWKSIPSWFVYGSEDRNIPAEVEAFMAKRAGAKETVRVEGASHVVMISHPKLVVRLIEAATAATCH
jgi:pimeloyl-ACP methyl ester carboxylesterase